MKENFEFVLRCINSCVNIWQLRTAQIMIDRFRERYGERTEYTDILDGAIVDQQRKIEVFA